MHKCATTTDFTRSPGRFPVSFSMDDSSGWTSGTVETVRPLQASPTVVYNNTSTLRTISLRRRTSPLGTKAQVSPILGRLASNRATTAIVPDGQKRYFLRGNTVLEIADRRKLLVQSIRAAKQTGDEFLNRLDLLLHCDQFFIQRTNVDSYGEDSSTYEVRNGNGQVIFRAVESILRLPQFTSPPADVTNPPVELSIFDPNAEEEVINIKSSLGRGVMLVYVRLSPTMDKFIGTVRRTYSRFLPSLPTYNLEGSDGLTVFKIQSLYPKVDKVNSILNCLTSNSGKHYKILLVDEVTCVGIVDKEEDKIVAFAHSSFPIETPLASKAMLLAATFFQHTNREYNWVDK